MKVDYGWFEKAITALEESLNAQVTIIDNQGLFHTPKGTLIFPPIRQSHRKLTVCNCGFSSRCIDFCRHRMNAESCRRRDAFVKTCWKGVSEIVVPLQLRGRHWGMFYLGAWRDENAAIPDELPEEFSGLYAALPVRREEKLNRLMPLLEAFAAGLLQRLEELNAVGLPPPDRAARIRDYVDHHAASPGADLAGLAAELHLSISRTSHLLQEYFGTGLISLIHRERISRAGVLLLSTDDKLAAIAAATGFSDEYHFSKVFRRITGETPGQFRSRNRPKNQF